jgi:hypothetical protein
MITRTKLPAGKNKYLIYRDGKPIGIVERYDARYWRILDLGWIVLKDRIRTLKSAIWELERITTEKEITK